ncbi:MAG TPA: S41 family peptidase [Bacteroidales bacterium]|nr:S41 family peptidase [Bacteroidales bacterium]
MKARFKRFKTSLLIVIPLVAVISFGFVSLKDKEFDIVKNLEIFVSLFNELDRFYVDDTNPDKLIKSAIDGMLTSLDPYTTYIPEEDMADFTFMTTGEYGGIGAQIRKAGNNAIILEPYENFPAQKAGLRAGDTILFIDGESTKGKEISAVSEKLKGTPNTSLKVVIKRPGMKESMEKTLVRQQITITNVPYYSIVDNGIGYIRLSGFTKDAGKETREALMKLKEQGAKSIILDLRGNPGGLLIEAVNVANIFVRRNQEIVSTRGKVKQWDNVYKTMSEPVDTIIPLVVLINRGSASASEIVAGAMQDLDRGVMVGQRTFGKGLVQTTRPVSYNSELKVTTAKYYIPSGRCIQAVDYSHRNDDGSVGYIPDSLINEFTTFHGRKVFDGGGITPDIPIEATPASDIAISLYTKNLIFDFATQYAANNPNVSSINQLKPNDGLYNKFIEFLKGKEYDYTTDTDEKLEALIKSAKQEKYYEPAIDEFTKLKTKLAHDKDKDLQTFKSEIESLLYEEIASRYYYQKGRIQATLNEDPELAKAIDVLKHPDTYAMVFDKSFGHENLKTGMQQGSSYEKAGN